MFRPHLESETNGEGGDAEIKNRVVERRRLIVSDRNRAARKNNSRGSRLLHIVGRYARGVGDDGENAELAELLHDEVVELRTHRKEEDEVLGLPHPHFFGYLGKSFRVGSLEDGQHVSHSITYRFIGGAGYTTCILRPCRREVLTERKKQSFH